MGVSACNWYLSKLPKTNLFVDEETSGVKNITKKSVGYSLLFATDNTTDQIGSVFIKRPKRPEGVLWASFAEQIGSPKLSEF